MRRIIVFTHPNQLHKADKLVGIYHYAHGLDWQLLCVESGASKQELASTLAKFRPNGVILEGDSAQTHLLPRRVPTVNLDANTRASSVRQSVESDAEKIAALAFDELRVTEAASALFVSLHAETNWSSRRREAFRRLCAPLRKRFAAVEYRGGNLVMSRERLSQALLRLPQPIAAFAANDNAAEALYAAAELAGVNIPTALRIVSVDNNPLICSNLRPTLSSIEQDFFRAGVSAAELLDRLMSNDRRGRHRVLIPPKGLVRRGSSAALPPCPKPVQKAILFIREHAAEGICVMDVVHEMRYARRTAESAFVAATGLSMHEMITTVRFKRVEQLLADPAQKIEPIANLCGWRSATHLMRAFRQRYGLSMSAWRTRHATARDRE